MIMALFGKKKEEVKSEPACCCGETAEVKEENASCCVGQVDGICCVKILGAGCKSCLEQYENAKKATKNLGLDIEVEYITDMEKVMSYGVMSMPALLVNDKIVSVGKVLKPKEIEQFLKG